MGKAFLAALFLCSPHAPYHFSRDVGCMEMMEKGMENGLRKELHIFYIKNNCLLYTSFMGFVHPLLLDILFPQCQMTP